MGEIPLNLPNHNLFPPTQWMFRQGFSTHLLGNSPASAGASSSTCAASQLHPRWVNGFTCVQPRQDGLVGTYSERNGWREHWYTGNPVYWACKCMVDTPTGRRVQAAHCCWGWPVFHQLTLARDSGGFRRRCWDQEDQEVGASVEWFKWNCRGTFR